MKNNYSVIVGNVGTIHSGHNCRKACKAYRDAVERAQAPHGRASGESVVLLANDGIIREYVEIED